MVGAAGAGESDRKEDEPAPDEEKMELLPF